tara:strand:+ start:52 stop:1164 length:1113 start_codon:yes stop_codon:yes gene_type:complete
MNKSYYSLGLMSGTSMDGIDASIIKSDGKTKYKVILNKFFKYSQKIYKNLTSLRNNVKNIYDLKKFKKEIDLVEREITFFHAKVVKDVLKKKKIKIDLIGFHGQTIFHDAKIKVSKQLGDGKLLSNLTKKIVVYNFRKNDLKNGGQGAPLTPIFHELIMNNSKLKLPALIINIGGISNITWKKADGKIISCDIGPGNCLIDQWMRLNSNKNYDNKGNCAKIGKVNKGRLEYLFNFYNKTGLKNYSSYDVYDFNVQIQYLKGLSLKDGAATLCEYTAEILSKKILEKKSIFFLNIILSGGGRKNKHLIKILEKKINFPLKLIDEYGFDGDFVESQAFAYLAIRSYLKLPISFPETTGCIKPCTGGVIAKNF